MFSKNFLLVLCIVIASSGFSSNNFSVCADGTVSSNANGDLVLTPTEGQDVIVNGVSFANLAERVASLELIVKTTQQALETAQALSLSNANEVNRLQTQLTATQASVSATNRAMEASDAALAAARVAIEAANATLTSSDATSSGGGGNSGEGSAVGAVGGGGGGGTIEDVRVVCASPSRLAGTNTQIKAYLSEGWQVAGLGGKHGTADMCILFAKYK